MTEQLALQDPRRKTALAVVSGHAAGGFLLDRTVFHAADPRYHHKQPCDRGHVLVAGEKRKIEKVAWDRGRLVHRATDALPAKGEKAQLHLDAPRRETLARAHTLMHLIIQAAAELRAQHLDAPEVVGGGEVKARLAFREAPALAAPKLMARVKALVAERAPVEALWMTREDIARVATPQAYPLDAIAPGEPTLRVVRIGACVLPCDAPLVEHAWQVGDVRWAPPQPTRDGVRLRAKVA